MDAFSSNFPTELGFTYGLTVRKFKPTLVMDDVFVEDSSSSELSLEWLEPAPLPSESEFGSESSGKESRSGRFFLDDFFLRSDFLVSAFGAGFSVGSCFTGARDVSVLDPEVLAPLEVVFAPVVLGSPLTSSGFALPAGAGGPKLETVARN
jgi:hypothetical protein